MIVLDVNLLFGFSAVVTSVSRRRMSDEVELKLNLRPEDADALEASSLLAGDPLKAQQKSIYFDTPDYGLAKVGLTLRIRRSGRKRIQTVKADGASSTGLFARPEWERPVPNDTPVIDDTTPIGALLGEATAEIVPAFEIYIDRRTWDIREGDVMIEMVLDRGEVVAGARRSSICEVELELKHGDPRALFALARKLDAVAPVRLGVLTKAERGYGLIGPVVTVFKAERVRLNRDMTAAKAFQHIVQTCVRQFRLNEDLLLDGRQPEVLHQARVALRRLRSAFSIFKAMLDDEVAPVLREELRWLTSELGEARNLDVLLERCPPGPLHDRLETAREAAYAGVEEVLASSRVRALMFDLAQWTVTGGWQEATGANVVRDQPAREFASAALDRFRRKVKKDGRDLAQADDEARHEVRKDAKKLRYAAEFFVALFDRKRERRRYKQFVTALEALQDQLGALNDLATSPGVLARLGASDDPSAAALLAPRSKKVLLENAEESHDRLIDVKPFWR